MLVAFLIAVCVGAGTIGSAKSAASPTLVPPLAVSIVSSSHTSVSLSWSAPSAHMGVVGYGVYANGMAVGTVSAVVVGTASWRGYTLSRLACGSSYSFAVDAYDAAGNRSRRASVTGSTAPCPPRESPAAAPEPVHSATPSTPSEPAAGPERDTSGSPADVLPPASPLGVGIIGAGVVGVALEWSTSWDNVAVTGYGVYKNGVSVGSTTADDETARRRSRIG